MEDFEARIRHLANVCVIDAFTSASGWNEHPTYNTRKAVRAKIDDALAVLRLLCEADGTLYSREARPVAYAFLGALRDVVDARKPGEHMILPPRPATGWGIVAA